jgi:DNA-binding MurR/RpiR family transcriptional regulator
MKKTPPETKDRNILQILRQSYDGLSDTYKKIAEFIINNMETATFVSLDELSKRVGVSDATLIRFARELGFEGYQSLREAMMDFIRGIIYPSRKLSDSAKIKNIQTLEAVRQMDIDFINKTFDDIDRDGFKQLIQLIISSKRIFTMGWGLSSFLAEYLTFQLQRLTYEAHAIIRERRPLLERMLHLKKGDLLIVFDILLYSAEVLEAVEYLHADDVDINLVTVTNDSTAHIVQYADCSFFIDTYGQGTMPSLTAPMCFINAIFEEIILRRPVKTKKALDKFQQEVMSNRKHSFQFDQNSLK